MSEIDDFFEGFKNVCIYIGIGLGSLYALMFLIWLCKIGLGKCLCQCCEHLCECCCEIDWRQCCYVCCLCSLFQKCGHYCQELKCESCCRRGCCHGKKVDLHVKSEYSDVVGQSSVPGPTYTQIPHQTTWSSQIYRESQSSTHIQPAVNKYSFRVVSFQPLSLENVSSVLIENEVVDRSRRGRQQRQQQQNQQQQQKQQQPQQQQQQQQIRISRKSRSRSRSK
ncbi:probable serine/threonine-protein kinase fhkB [Physella acuta]|uniref:probable serine/threonine-protein kinase fhkB n=1 Tax=Physella acuta TaxID=109671 RepID=UPI0027DE1A2E|nr:probable serine/threonine-protein kinase fhkB [Physella acuta]